MGEFGFGCCSFFIGWLLLAMIDAIWMGKHLQVLMKTLLPRFLVANAIAMLGTAYLAAAIPTGVSPDTLDPYLAGKIRTATTWCIVFGFLVLIKWPFFKAAAGPKVAWGRALAMSLPAQAIGYGIMFGCQYIAANAVNQIEVTYRDRLSRAHELPAAWIYFVNPSDSTLNRARFGDMSGYFQRVSDKQVPTIGPEASSAVIWERNHGFVLHVFSYTWTGSAWSHKLKEQPKPEQLEHYVDSFRKLVHEERYGNPAEVSGGVRSFYANLTDAPQYDGHRTLRLLFGEGGQSTVYTQTTDCPDHPQHMTVLPNGFAYFSLGSRIYILDMQRRELTYWLEGLAPCAILYPPGITGEERKARVGGGRYTLDLWGVTDPWF